MGQPNKEKNGCKQKGQRGQLTRRQLASKIEGKRVKERSKNRQKRREKREQNVRKKTREARMIRSEDKKQGSRYTEEGKKEKTCN